MSQDDESHFEDRDLKKPRSIPIAVIVALFIGTFVGTYIVNGDLLLSLLYAAILSLIIGLIFSIIGWNVFDPGSPEFGKNLIVSIGLLASLILLVLGAAAFLIRNDVTTAIGSLCLGMAGLITTLGLLLKKHKDILTLLASLMFLLVPLLISLQIENEFSRIALYIVDLIFLAFIIFFISGKVIKKQKVQETDERLTSSSFAHRHRFQRAGP